MRTLAAWKTFHTKPRKTNPIRNKTLQNITYNGLSRLRIDALGFSFLIVAQPKYFRRLVGVLSSCQYEWKSEKRTIFNPIKDTLPVGSHWERWNNVIDTPLRDLYTESELIRTNWLLENGYLTNCILFVMKMQEFTRKVRAIINHLLLPVRFSI